jgi:hypothetical protein
LLVRQRRLASIAIALAIVAGIVGLGFLQNERDYAASHPGTDLPGVLTWLGIAVLLLSAAVTCIAVALLKATTADQTETPASGMVPPSPVQQRPVVDARPTVSRKAAAYLGLVVDEDAICENERSTSDTAPPRPAERAGSAANPETPSQPTTSGSVDAQIERVAESAARWQGVVDVDASSVLRMARGCASINGWRLVHARAAYETYSVWRHGLYVSDVKVAVAPVTRSATAVTVTCAPHGSCLSEASPTSNAQTVRLLANQILTLSRD